MTAVRGLGWRRITLKLHQRSCLLYLSGVAFAGHAPDIGVGLRVQGQKGALSTPSILGAPKKERSRQSDWILRLLRDTGNHEGKLPLAPLPRPPPLRGIPGVSITFER